VTVNGVLVVDDVVANHATYDSVECYSGNPWHTPADVTVSNLVITGPTPPAIDFYLDRNRNGNGDLLGKCAADCDNDGECEGALICWQRSSGDYNHGSDCGDLSVLDNPEHPGWDYCVEAPPTHWIAAGNPGHSTWNGLPTQECVSDSSARASQGNRFGTDIAVSCCTLNGSGGKRFNLDDSKCNQAKTFQEAFELCAQSGHRLCTLKEMLGKKTAFTGCNHDHRYNWVSDSCFMEVNAAAASNSNSYNEVTGSGEGTISFDDFIPMILGAAAGAAVIAGIVAFVVAMRKKNAVKKVRVELGVHVPDNSVAVSVDGNVSVVTAPEPDVVAVPAE